VPASDRIGSGSTDEEASVGAGHGSVDDNDAAGGVRAGDGTGESHSTAGSGLLAAHPSGGCRMDLEVEASRHLESVVAVSDPQVPGDSGAELVVPTAVRVGAGGADHPEILARDVGAGLDADAGTRDRVALAVADLSAEHRPAPVPALADSLAAVGDLGGDPLATSNR